MKIKVAKPGFNVLTETDPDNLIYSSDYDTLKYHASGSVNVKPLGSSLEATVAHGLGYIPYFTAYVDNFAGPAGVNYHMCPGKFDDVPGYIDADVYADSTNLYFKVHTDYLNDVITFNFRYFIFRNRLGL